MTAERTVAGFNGSKVTRIRKEHVIDDISYSKDFIVCSCAWKGPTAEFPVHRKSLGLPRRR